MIDEMDVARLMRAEFEAAEPPSAVVNIERAMTAGRRQRWYARSAGAALAVVAVVVGAVTVPGLVAPADRSPSLGPFGTPAPLEPSAGKTPSPDTSRIPAALETIDPTIQYVRFGWLPSGLARLSYSAGQMQLGLGVSLSGHAPGSPNPGWMGVSVDLYPKGVTPKAPQVMGIDQRAPVVSTAPAPDVRGEAATFTLYDVDGDTDRLSLRWQYAPDGWAEVDVTPWAAGQDAREIALHVAQTLRFSTTERVQMPGQVTGLPQRLRPICVSVDGPLTPDGWRWYADVDYSAEPLNADHYAVGSKTLKVSFFPYVEMTDKIRAELQGKELYRTPNTTIDGHQASFLKAEDPEWLESLEVFDVRGMAVQFDARRGALDEPGTKGLFQHLDLAGARPDWRPSLLAD
ncbi:hypothetical protein ACGFIW_10350 [Micromonospora sp. NPDC048935]|uniref:hypothetical protein n=1 Tax=Micromonospora sp. NPDC048935 TaxID=3364262 RepID=UPI00371B4E1E